MVQEALFEAEAKYSIDTNVVVSFLGDGDAELYPVDVFGPQWTFLEAAIRAGRVIAARRVETELKKWERIERMKAWLHNHKYVFQDVDSDAQLIAAKDTVNRYPAYGLDVNRLGDLEVMSLAKARGLAVISLESQKQHRAARPKIPNVCQEFAIGHVGFHDFLRAEGFAERGT
ncbi:DUF4411 family protein [Nocardioides lijunqiniae]|uniref:DUF4411 family protein n=1 Tax=Nocardioides lijunqiniae TaxID=2760832 RepID=UPI001878B524|nr:DUF4411 family protein [Nocardioides lijunqiniae]